MIIDDLGWVVGLTVRILGCSSFHRGTSVQIR